MDSEDPPADPSDATFAFEVFYDGECPLCLREIRMLQKLDRQERLRFTDIAAPGFDARELGVDHATLMAKIHGRMPDGTLVTGVEVFRQLYGAVGFAPVIPLTRIPGISHLLDASYELFAKNRLRLTGRCQDGACAVPEPRA